MTSRANPSTSRISIARPKPTASPRRLLATLPTLPRKIPRPQRSQTPLPHRRTATLLALSSPLNAAFIIPNFGLASIVRARYPPKAGSGQHCHPLTSQQPRMPVVVTEALHENRNDSWRRGSLGREVTEPLGSARCP